MLKELKTEKGRELALHGGGGDKARNERTAALATILAAQEHIKDNPKSTGELKPTQAFSIVDAASAASVHGRSAVAFRKIIISVEASSWISRAMVGVTYWLISGATGVVISGGATTAPDANEQHHPSNVTAT
ncbi:hypothetical protein Tco_0630858 [Tanacetum coccineum]